MTEKRNTFVAKETTVLQTILQEALTRIEKLESRRRAERGALPDKEAKEKDVQENHDAALKAGGVREKKLSYRPNGEHTYNGRERDNLAERGSGNHELGTKLNWAEIPKLYHSSNANIASTMLKILQTAKA